MISKDAISLVRDRTDLVAVVSESVPSLKKRGRRFLGLCPFHQEKTPSFHVNPDSGLYYCFGCKETGDVFRFLERVEGYTFVEAVKSLAERAGIPIHEENAAAPSDADRLKKEREALFGVLQMAAAWYEQQLREHPQRNHAVAELERRGLQPTTDAVQAFRIGYAPPGWDGLASFLKTQGVSPAVAESVGLLVPRTSAAGYYDRFRHRLMFAVLDAQGRVVAFSGRALAPLEDTESPDTATARDKPGAPPRDPPPKYINSPESPIYVKGSHIFGLWQARHAIRRAEQAIVVEGNFDVVSLHARGLENVVAPLGTAFTVEQARLLRRYAVQVTLLFDADAAGRKAARAAEGPCDEAGLDAKVALLPDRTDPDEFVRNKGEKALRHVVGQARGLFEYLIDVELDLTFNAADAIEVAARVERVVTIIERQKDPMRRAMLEAYADYAASRLDLVRSAPNAWGALRRRVMAATRAARVHAGPRPSEARIRPRRPGQDERKAIIGAVLDFPVLLDDSELQGVLPLLEGESARIVAAIRLSMRANAAGEKVLDSSEFLAQMPPAIQAFASARLAAPAHDTIDEARATVSANEKKLRDSNIAREANEIVREQHRVVGDWDTELELARQADSIVRGRQGLMGTRVLGASLGAQERMGQKHRGSDGDEES
ncbi:MAG TPA: CHC2 zinc finger domain-containing protein [Polyangiaceae bacterium]|nr:CHC2 zinc finger domain-containing protein [Polyangiaceae bacterium]